MPFPGARMYFYKAESFDRSELDGRFVESQPPIGWPAQYRAFSLAANFRQTLLVATVTVETTFNKQRIDAKIIGVPSQTCDKSYAPVCSRTLDLTEPNSQKKKKKKKRPITPSGHSKWWYSAVAWRLFVIICG